MKSENRIECCCYIFNQVIHIYSNIYLFFECSSFVCLMQQITNPHEYIYTDLQTYIYIYSSFERRSFVCFFNKLQVYINIYTNLQIYTCIFSSFECNSFACLLQQITNLGGFKYQMCVYQSQELKIQDQIVCLYYSGGLTKGRGGSFLLPMSVSVIIGFTTVHLLSRHSLSSP